MIRRGHADEGERVVPPPNYSREESARSMGNRAMPTPLTSRSPSDHPHPYQRPPYSYGPSDAYLPLHPHAISPYDFTYPSHGSVPSSLSEASRHISYDPYYHPSRGYYSSSGSAPGRGQRQLISCFPCRRRKLKCDGAKPCAQCLRRGNEGECGYATHVRRRGKGKKKDGDESSTGSSRMGSIEMGRGYESSDSLGNSQRHDPRPDDQIPDPSGLSRLRPSRESSYDPVSKEDGVMSRAEAGSRSYRIQLSPDRHDLKIQDRLSPDQAG